MIEIDTFSSLGKAVIKTEIEAIQQLESRISEDFDTACQICLECTGRIVVLGMGKSGHIGSKIAATLASTGTPAFFVIGPDGNITRLFGAQPYEVFVETFEIELKKSKN